MLTLGWILSTGVGSVSSVLVASNFFTGLTPQLMDSVFAFGFIAAAIGGLDSPVGAIVSGITLGIALQFVGDFVNSNAIILTALIVLIASLMLRPNGLFTKNAARRV
jgi:branched-chain amino acid transport system permease protein